MKKTTKKTKKIKNKKKLITTLIAVASVIVIAISSLFVIDSFAPANPKCYHKFVASTFNGSYDKDGLPKSYWQVSPVKMEKDGKVDFATFYARYYVQYESSSEYTSEIWINVSDFYGDSTKITIAKGGGPLPNITFDEETYEYALTKNKVKNSEDGWIKIFDSDWKGTFDVSSMYLWVGFKNAKIRVREIAFISSEGNLSNKYNDVTNMGLYDEDANVIANMVKGVEKTTDEYDLVSKRFKK